MLASRKICFHSILLESFLVRKPSGFRSKVHLVVAGKSCLLSCICWSSGCGMMEETPGQSIIWSTDRQMDPIKAKSRAIPKKINKKNRGFFSPRLFIRDVHLYIPDTPPGKRLYVTFLVRNEPLQRVRRRWLPYTK